MRRSPATQRNHELGDWSKWAETNNNLKFFGEALKVMAGEFNVGNRGLMTIGLVGSRDIPGVTLRQAQSVLRWDRRPSLWSHAFLIGDTWNGRATSLARLPIYEVPLFPRTGIFPKPEMNGLNTEATLGNYEDPELDANVALLAVSRRAKKEDGSVTIEAMQQAEVDAVAKRAEDPNYDRLRYDLWDTLSAWQQYLWSGGRGTNPLSADIPVPASAYVEMTFEAIGLDLVPGASERNSAPEHIWNAAVWWHQKDSKEKTDDDSPYVLTGCFALRDRGCSLLSHDD